MIDNMTTSLSISINDIIDKITKTFMNFADNGRMRYNVSINALSWTLGIGFYTCYGYVINNWAPLSNFDMIIRIQVNQIKLLA